ncbi:MAG TPA: hypothetical protein VID27_08410, partial [Blastocatellia bacterium]
MRFLKENVLVCISALIAILIWIQKVLKNESPVIEGSKDEMKQETGGPRTEPDVMCKVTREIYDHWANITHPKLKGFAQDEILQFMEHFKQLTEGKIFG